MSAPVPEHTTMPVGQPAVITLLDSAAACKGDDIGRLCDILHITEGFYRQLATGIRPVSTVSLELAKGMADYVGLSLDEMYKVLHTERPGTQPPHLVGERRKFH